MIFTLTYDPLTRSMDYVTTIPLVVVAQLVEQLRVNEQVREKLQSQADDHDKADGVVEGTHGTSDDIRGDV